MAGQRACKRISLSRPKSAVVMVLSIQLPFAHKQEGIPQTDSLKETPNNHLPQKGDALNPLVKVICSLVSGAGTPSICLLPVRAATCRDSVPDLVENGPHEEGCPLDVRFSRQTKGRSTHFGWRLTLRHNTSRRTLSQESHCSESMEEGPQPNTARTVCALMTSGKRSMRLLPNCFVAGHRITPCCFKA